MENPFKVSVDTLAALSAKPAEELVKRMILAEAGSAKVGIDQVRTGGRPDSTDGGVDFEVKDAPQDSDGGLIKKGHTLYHVEPGDFSPSTDVPAVLFKRGGELRDAVRECLGAGGTLSVLLTRWGGSSAARSGLEERFADALRDRLPARAGGSVKVWEPGRIAGLVDAYPQLALYVNGASDGLYTHDDWSQFDDMSHVFRSGGAQDEFIRKFRAHLLDGDGPVHVRVSGEHGAGKTRMVLEATRDDRLRGNVVYADGPRRLAGMMKHAHTAGAGGGRGTILVVDDCSYLEQAGIWSEVKSYAGMRLVTIHSEEDQIPGEAVKMQVPPLGGEQLREIISSYVSDGGTVGDWADYCKASPRAAHIVGASLRDSRGNTLRQLDAAAVWDRYIAGQNDPRGEDFRVRKAVLMWLSLFKEFERDGGSDGSEIGRIAALIEEHEGIPKGRFLGAVDELRRKKVLQGASTLYITPKLLHIHMWAEWWGRYTPDMAPGAGQIGGGEGGGAGAVPGRLLQRYLDMFRYAKGSPVSAKIAKDMMRPGGLLDSDGLLGRSLGSDFFLSLGPIDPASALACIGRIADRAGAGLARVRPGIVGAIERILVGDSGSGGGDAFADAARLLLKLAVAGRGTQEELVSAPNPALDAYCGAFDLAGSRSAAPARARLALLGEAMRSASAVDRRAAVHACGEALAMRRRSIAIPHCVGFERVPDPWVPRDRAEAVSYYRDAVELIGAAALGDADAGIRKRAAAIAVDTMRQTMIIPEVSPSAVSLLESLVAAGEADGGALVDGIDFLLGADRDRIDAPSAARLESLRDSVAGTGLSADLRRLVGRDAWDGGDAAGPDLGALADAALRDGAPARHLEWLATCGTARAYRFGREVGARDPRLGLLGRMLGAMRAAGASASASFLRGYLEPAAEAGALRGEMEDMLDGMLGDAALRRHAPGITASVGATDRSVERLARGVRGGLLDGASLRVLGGGGLLDGASPGAVAGLAASVLGAGKRAGADRGAAAAAALGLLHSRFVAGPRPAGIALAPGRLVLDVLLDEGLLGQEGGRGKGGEEPPDHVVRGEWRDVAAAYAGLGGDGALELADAMVRRLGDSPLLRAHGQSRPASVLAQIAVSRPREVRGLIAARLGPPAGLDEALPLLEWLGDGGGLGPPRGPGDGGAAERAEAAAGLSAALVPWIVEWAAADPGGRAALAARHLPPHLPSVLEFVARFGARRDASGALAARLASGGRGGSAAARRAHRGKEALRLAGAEPDPGVRLWLERYAASLGWRVRDGGEREGAPAGLEAREPLAAGAV